MIDLNGDGITRDELRTFFLKLDGRAFKKLNHEEVEDLSKQVFEMFAKMDKNGDKNITLEEFLLVML